MEKNKNKEWVRNEIFSVLTKRKIAFASWGGGGRERFLPQKLVLCSQNNQNQCINVLQKRACKQSE